MEATMFTGRIQSLLRSVKVAVNDAPAIPKSGPWVLH